MLNIQYFASIREALNKSEEEFKLPRDVKSVQELIDSLVSANPHYEAVFIGSDDNKRGKTLVAVNQTIVDRNHPLSENDEVAFFPPMTGG
jgi:molybdopterin synthase sulfur carrier subunit|tara:strand:+ start:1032 stop:1301 length:270 start_codon:yes stop_codon:yes gene_type:complete